MKGDKKTRASIFNGDPMIAFIYMVDLKCELRVVLFLSSMSIIVKRIIYRVIKFDLGILGSIHFGLFVVSFLTKAKKLLQVVLS